MSVSVVVGTQWGDEGKGKLVDLLAQTADVCCRCAGGNNAGHTVKVGETTYDFHLLPSGIISPKCVSLLGNGVVISLRGMFEEVEHNRAIGPALEGWESRLRISSRAHLVLDLHQDIDGLNEAEKNKSGDGIGTTKKGIGPTYAAKADRIGFRVCDLFLERQEFEDKLRTMVFNYQKRYADLKVDVAAQVQVFMDYAERLRPLVVDSIALVHEALESGKGILVEGSQATMLDIDFGTYPFVTSSNCTIGGVCTGLGIPPQRITDVFGVVKAYTTRVGGGCFPTEEFGETGAKLQDIGHEIGVTTKRKRRCGWLDLVVVKYAARINGLTAICLTKLDVLDTFESLKVAVAYSVDGQKLPSFPADQHTLKRVEVEYVTLPGWQQSIRNCRSFNDLPANAQKYVRFVEETVGVPVKWIGVGPDREDTIIV